MNALFYAMLGLSIIVAQTSVLRLPVFHGIFYDLLIPVVVFLGLRLRDVRGVSLVAAFGIIMDLLSGGIFGLYLSTYLWTFLLVKSVSKYFNVEDKIFQSILIAACVLGEHVVFCAWLAPPWRDPQVLAYQAASVVMQIMLAALTGPAVFAALNRFETRFGTAPGSPRKESEELAPR